MEHIFNMRLSGTGEIINIVSPFTQCLTNTDCFKLSVKDFTPTKKLMPVKLKL